MATECLLDTGVLLRLFDFDYQGRAGVVKAVKRLRRDGVQLVAARQNLAEFWSVMTRPAESRGGYG